MNAITYYSEAIKKVDSGEITIGEYERMIKVLRDVEPVVRCRDCLYWQKSNLFSEHMVCRYVVDCSVVRRESDFCSRGERKGGEAHGTK